MCSKVINLYTANKSMLNGIDELESHFMNLHMMLIALKGEYQKQLGNIDPLLKEKNEQKMHLENLIKRFTAALEKYTASRTSGKRQKNKIFDIPAHHLSESELIELSPLIIGRVRNSSRGLGDFGIRKDDIEDFEEEVTSFILSMPMRRLLKEKVEEVISKEKEIIQDIDYLLCKLIDPHMSVLQNMEGSVYSSYLKARMQEGNGRLKGHTGRKDESVLA
jgi:hypothetical protein